MNIESSELASLIIHLAEEKKAQDIVILDLGGMSILCDIFIIASATTRVQTKAIAKGIDEKLKNIKLPKRQIHGLSSSTWILIDYGNVVTHIFTDQERAFYDLEGLWKNVPRLDIDEMRKKAGNLLHLTNKNRDDEDDA